jgi:hypothetical protein
MLEIIDKKKITLFSELILKPSPNLTSSLKDLIEAFPRLKVETSI